MERWTSEETVGAEKLQMNMEEDKKVPKRMVELELNLHQMMELAGTFGVVIRSMVEEPEYT
jgi:hypothetical protein